MDIKLLLLLHVCVSGMPCSTGMISRAGFVANTDAPAVALLKRAGAIPLGVTNTSELCMWLESNNHLYGITNNPYDTTRICGGSSGRPAMLKAQVYQYGQITAIVSSERL